MKMKTGRFIRQGAITFALLFTAFQLCAESMSPLQIFQVQTNAKSIVIADPDLPANSPQKKVLDFRFFKQVAKDRQRGDDAVFSAASTFLSSWGSGEDDFQPVNKVLETNRPPYLAKLIGGHYLIDLAWKARGSDYANKVDASQWTQFAEKLKKAEAELERAWELNPKQPLIAEEMMTLELGQGKGRDRLELWFQRAMQLNPNDYRACCQKLYYLEPKWYGSAQAEIAFGRECVASTNWGGEVPLVLVEAHRAVVNYLPDEKQNDYWSSPTVWKDLKSAYSKYLKTHPKDLLQRSNYAIRAYMSHDWDVLNEQLLLLGPDNYRFLGDEDKIFDIVGAAKRHAADSK
jgi:hypothetical protein